MDCIALLKKYTKHRNAAITESGDDALLAALKIVRRINPKRTILIPNQGGWLTYKDYPKRFGFDVIEMKTNKGVINLEILRNFVANAAALLITSFAGYYAEQPLKEISKICRNNGCLLVEDVSGSLGDSYLCNGEYADVIFCSFGRWKIADYGRYGFVSSNFNLGVHSLDGDSKLFEKIKDARLRLDKLIRLAEKVKRDLSDFDIFHRDKRGINVIVGYEQKVIDYCDNNGYEYIICPRYIKVMEKAISIELKRKNV